MIADEFKELLQKFVKNECELGEVITNLHQLLKKHPQLATPIQGQIDLLASKKRIDQSAVDAISKVTASYAVGENDDKTVISGADDDDADTTEIASHTQHNASADYDDDSTLINESISDDATAIEDNDATMVSNTNVPPPSDDGFGLDLDTTGTDSTATGPTIGADGMPIMTHGDDVIDVGSVLRNRFKLIGKLGEGGMGAVFVAVDQIKEEAQDKNPRVAVKVLNETFKQFRESFIALQRESSKQQRLAHPNIATVFDFDRDYTYGTVFMTMEMLEGDPLDKFIRRVPPDGLSYEEAKPLIDGMCNGLAYAHSHDLVHSDFKPANIFLNKEGVVKLLDFGIARAAKPKVGADGVQETTLFDPGTLGALTPAYASTEMLEGETPTPPDDIYALAAVTYQLLAGKHPFNKMPANQAKDNKLTPAPIKKLNRRQSKALMKGLAFDRDKRTQTVDEFLDGITPKKPILAYVMTVLLVLFTIIGILGKGVIEDKIRDNRNKEMALTLTTDTAKIATHLDRLKTFEDESQDLIKADPDVQNAIVGYFIRRIDSRIDKTKDLYDYPGAAQVMLEARKYYKDSGKLDAKQEDINTRKADELENQRDLFTRFLKIGPWLPKEGKNNDIPDVIATLKKIDPKNELLRDPRLAGSYIKQAQGARQKAEFDRAENLLEQADKLTQIPSDKIAIANETDEVSLSRHLTANQESLKILLAKVSSAKASESLTHALSVGSELGQIRLLEPENKLLTDTAKMISAALLKSIKASKNKTSLSQTTNQFQTLAMALSTEEQQKIRTTLNAAWQKAGGIDSAITQQKQEDSKALLDQIAEASATPEFTHEWTQSLKSLTLKLEALVGHNHVSTQQTRRQLADLFIKQATTASENERLVLGNNLISDAKFFDAATPGLEKTEQTIAEALKVQEDARIATETQATIIALKQDTLSKAKSEKVENALRFLDLLKIYLPPDDPFLTTEGPEAIGTAYASIAMRAKKRADGIQKNYVAQRDGYNAALEQIKTGLGIAPASKALADAKTSIEVALSITEVRNTFSTSEKLDVANLKAQLNSIRSHNSTVFTRLQTEYAEIVAQRISTMESYDTNAAKSFLDAAKLLPINQRIIGDIDIKVVAPSKYSQKIIAALKDSLLSEASNILKQALNEESDHPEIRRLRGALANKVTEANKAYKLYQTALKNKQYEESKGLIAKALKIWRDNTEFKAAFKASNISIIASRDVCEKRLAGYGRKSKGRCYDMVSRTTKGPIMVVVPPGAGHSSPFAMSKFEISVNDFNQFCEQTKKCPIINKGPKLPVTGISLSQAKEYVAWISKVSGAKYRIPTDKEWAHAASAAGKQPRGKSYNCTLRLGDKVMKGTGLEDVNSGKQNGWGLVNYLGNAQEWVETSSGLKARGGAYSDAMLKCTIELERAHDGSPDAITTFRVVRDIT